MAMTSWVYRRPDLSGPAPDYPEIPSLWPYALVMLLIIAAAIVGLHYIPL